MREFRWLRVGANWAAGLLVLNLHPTAACQQGAPREYREVHLGLEVRLLLDGDPAQADIAARVAFDRIDSLESILSDWRHDSELRRLEGAPIGQWTPVSAPLRDVLALALTVAQRTDGAFDPTIGSLTRLWREERRTGVAATDAARRTAQARVDWRAVTLDSAGARVRLERRGLAFDLGAIAKGWILDRAADTLAALGVRSALLEAGGDIVVRGAPAGRDGWRISVGERVVTLIDGAVSSSGPTAQWVRDADGTVRSHVIDPATGRGRADGTGVTVVGRSGAVSDAIATALAVVPRSDWPGLLKEFGVELVEA
jgi:thiamine biosynthesis lipoprotein